MSKKVKLVAIREDVLDGLDLLTDYFMTNGRGQTIDKLVQEFFHSHEIDVSSIVRRPRTMSARGRKLSESN